MSILSGHKQVIIIGNDGVVHYLSKGGTCEQKLALAWSDEGFVDTLKESIIETGRNVAVQLIFDVTEQQYRKETIPPISMFDKGRVVKRKVNMVYPSHEVRAYLPLKQKPKEGKGAVYLFAALPATKEVDMVVEAVIESNVTIAGMMLLPMEGTTLTKKLSDLYFKSNQEKRSKWTVLMGHHKTGGIRQVVIRDGELALTRLTPVGQRYLKQPTQIAAKEMIKEFSATLTYLARFGYMASDGLDLIIVAGADVASQFEEANFDVSHLKIVTVGQAINDLKLGKIAGIMQEDQSADILHASWISKQRKHVMPLAMKKIDALQKARLFARSAVLVLFFLMFGLGAYVAHQWTEINQVKIETSEQKAQKVKLQAQYDEAAKVFDVLEYDPEEIRMILSVYNSLKDKSVDPNPSFLAIKESLIGAMTIQSLTFDAVDTELESQYTANPDTEKNIFDMGIRIQFPINRDTAVNVRDTEAFIQKLKANFPNRTVKGIRMPGDLSVDKTVQGVSRNAENLGVNSSVEQTGDFAEIVITGEAL